MLIHGVLLMVILFGIAGIGVYFGSKSLRTSYAFEYLKSAEIKLVGGDTFAFWNDIRVASRLNYDLVEAVVSRGRIDLRAARDATLSGPEKEDMLIRFRESLGHCSSDRRWGNKVVRDNIKNIIFVIFLAGIVVRLLALVG